MNTRKTDLQKAMHLADIADAITLRFYRKTKLRIATKPDKTPITEADMAADQALRRTVTKEYGDAYLSEEGNQAHVAGRQWVVDPIDGTKNFMRGMPIWGTLISLQDETGTLTAVVSAPALGRRWWAARRKGAWTRDVDGSIRRIHVSQISVLSNAYVTYGTLLSWDEVPAGAKAVLELFKATWRERGLGDFLGHVLVAEGAVDACVEPNTKEWDMAAPNLIITEAGGSVWTNSKADMAAATPRVIITSNGLLENALRRALKQ